MKTLFMRWLVSCALSFTVVGCGGPDPTDPANKLATSSSSLEGEDDWYDESGNGGDWYDESGNGGGEYGYFPVPAPFPLPPLPLPAPAPAPAPAPDPTEPQIVNVTAPSPNLFCTWFGIFCGGSSEPEPQPQPQPQPPPPEIPNPMQQERSDAYWAEVDVCTNDHTAKLADCSRIFETEGSSAYWGCKDDAGRELGACMKRVSDLFGY
ncbi:hypothetical protein [Pyxidicoccus caerfyrddinensis]|uniref:hypothetical protein n=1 Tax=Pyxidicoccus caerfyrddinensis TaxID=2709663 RepID=UPI0013DD4C85|nr:hypothetical protein [Pyxidicoccus caerfyrddinensis]